MKRKLFLFAFVAFLVCNIIKANTSSDDSTKVFDSGNKRVTVTENTEKQRVEVEVYELQEDGDHQPYEKIFEGHYRDGKSREQRKHLMSIDIPSPIRKRTFESQNKYNFPHQKLSFGVGFAGFADRGDLEDIPFRTGRSPEISLMMYQKALSLSRNNQWSIVSGLGIRWARYHLKGNHYFKEIDDYTDLLTASDDLNFKKSKLGITTLNLPLLLEWRTRKSGIVMSAGGVCSFKTASSSRIEYTDKNGAKRKEKVDSGMTLRPVTFDLLFQAGTPDIGLFFLRYSPVSLFERNKGPELYPLTVGVMFYLD
jgi:hypothetical protein